MRAGLVLGIAGGVAALVLALLPVTIGAPAGTLAGWALVELDPPPSVPFGAVLLADVQAVAPALVVVATVLLWRRPRLAAEWLRGAAWPFLGLDGLLTASVVQLDGSRETVVWVLLRVAAAACVLVAAVSLRSVAQRDGGDPGRALGALCLLGAWGYVVLAWFGGLGVDEAPDVALLVAAVLGGVMVAVFADPADGRGRAAAALCAYGLAGTVFWGTELVADLNGYGRGALVAYSGGGSGSRLAVAAATACFAAVGAAGLRSWHHPAWAAALPGPERR